MSCECKADQKWKILRKNAFFILNYLERKGKYKPITLLPPEEEEYTIPFP